MNLHSCFRNGAMPMVTGILTEVFAEIGPATPDAHHHTFPSFTDKPYEQLDWLLFPWLRQVVKLYASVIVLQTLRFALSSVVSGCRC